jgi:hypothetical protein
VQPSVFLYTIHLNQLDEAGKRGLGLHHFENGIVVAVAAIIQQERCHYMKRRVVFLLWLNQPRPIIGVSMSRTCRIQYTICRRT